MVKLNVGDYVVTLSGNYRQVSKVSDTLIYFTNGDKILRKSPEKTPAYGYISGKNFIQRVPYNIAHNVVHEKTNDIFKAMDIAYKNIKKSKEIHTSIDTSNMWMLPARQCGKTGSVRYIEEYLSNFVEKDRKEMDYSSIAVEKQDSTLYEKRILVYGINIKTASEETLLSLIERLAKEEKRLEALNISSTYVDNSFSKIEKACRKVVEELDSRV